ncbi:hypothetical protein BH20GEM3_BH20GEM3_07430 [soil metagenome]
MKIAAVASSPTSDAHTRMAAEAPRKLAEVMGHTIQGWE